MTTQSTAKRHIDTTEQYVIPENEKNIPSPVIPVPVSTLYTLTQEMLACLHKMNHTLEQIQSDIATVTMRVNNMR
jgi:hypothetical protein